MHLNTSLLRTAFPALAGVVLACNSLGAQAAAPTTVQLKFNWPNKLHAQVVQTTVLSSGGASPASQTLENRYLRSAQKMGNKMRISVSGFKLAYLEGGAPLPAEQHAKLEAFARAIRPPYLVSAKGEFLAVDHYADFVVVTRAELWNLNEWQTDNLQLRNAIDEITSDQTLTTAASSEWDSTVGKLAGMRFEVGKLQQREADMPMGNPRVPKVKAVSTFSLGEPFACKRAGRVRQCLEVEITSTPKPGEAGSAIVPFLPPEVRAAMPDLKSVGFTMTMKLQTEPDSLIPHQYTMKKVIQYPSADGKTQEVLYTEETTTVYHYQ